MGTVYATEHGTNREHGGEAFKETASANEPAAKDSCKAKTEIIEEYPALGKRGLEAWRKGPGRKKSWNACPVQKRPTRRKALRISDRIPPPSTRLYPGPAFASTFGKREIKKRCCDDDLQPRQEGTLASGPGGDRANNRIPDITQDDLVYYQSPKSRWQHQQPPEHKERLSWADVARFPKPECKQAKDMAARRKSQSSNGVKQGRRSRGATGLHIPDFTSYQSFVDYLELATKEFIRKCSVLRDMVLGNEAATEREYHKLLKVVKKRKSQLFPLLDTRDLCGSRIPTTFLARTADLLATLAHAICAEWEHLPSMEWTAVRNGMFGKDIHTYPLVNEKLAPARLYQPT
ncbi:hypothetical protein PG993_011403 [Apiospora rasikravindrae]|uniref:Uncharacterized protein n=1 Tax=Apiospora rasikravindrae TaxID=990691 RepID=A0ABR1SE54_9PEZI